MNELLTALSALVLALQSLVASYPPPQAADGYGMGFVNYPTVSLIGTGEITSTMIKNGDIVNADISNSAAISATKIAGGGSGGNVMLAATGGLATSTNFTYSTSTDTLTVTGNLSVSGTTTISGVAYNFPDADGSANEVISTNGAGQLDWVAAGQSGSSTPYTSVNSTSNQNIDTTFTTGFEPKAIILHWWLQGWSTTATTYSTGISNYAGTTLRGTHWNAQNLASGASVVASSMVTDANAPSSGSGCSGNSGVVTLSVPSVSSTGFTVRAAFTCVQGNNQFAKFWAVAIP